VKYGDLLLGFSLLVGLQLAGEALVKFLGIPFPGSVAGMLMLLVLLMLFGERLLNRIARAADMLLRNLTLLFFGPVVALVLDAGKFAPWAAPLAVAIGIGTPLAMLTLALVLKHTVPPETSEKSTRHPSPGHSP
jgi:holin-like protein